MWSLLGAEECPNTEELGALGQKIFENFSRAYENTDPIDGIEVILAGSANENKNPVVVQGSQVGVMLWSVPVMFQYAYRRLFCGTPEKISTEDMDRLTRSVVLCCADCTTAWNRRKRMILEHDPQAGDLFRELDLCRLALCLHPKSSETFAHRRWVASKLLRDSEIFLALAKSTSTHECSEFNDSEGQKLLEIVQNEYEICAVAGEKQKSNYSAWAHKSWVTKNCISAIGEACFQHASVCHCGKSAESLWKKFVGFLSADIKIMTAFSRKHVSDISILDSLRSSLHALTDLTFFPLPDGALCDKFSGPSLDEVLQAVCKQWRTTLHHNFELLRLHRGEHEALWSFRRNLLLNFRKSVSPLLASRTSSCGSEVQAEITQLEQDFSFENEEEVWEGLRDCSQPVSGNGTTGHVGSIVRHLGFAAKFLK